MKSQDLCEKVTTAIIAELETGVMPWSKPWAGRTGGPVMPRRHAGARYRGINVLILWGAAEAAGYGPSANLGDRARRNGDETAGNALLSSDF
jgi:antirestriction protein ArdC